MKKQKQMYMCDVTVAPSPPPPPPHPPQSKFKKNNKKKKKIEGTIRENIAEITLMAEKWKGEKMLTNNPLYFFQPVLFEKTTTKTSNTDKWYIYIPREQG